MDLKTLRLTVIENAGLLAAGLMAPQRIDRLINRAVEHVVNIVEQAADLYNIEADPIATSVVSGTEVYYLNAASASATPTIFIRKILFAERTDQNWGGRPITCAVVDFRDRNRYGTGSYWPDRVGGFVRPIIYFVRNSAGVWHLGFVYDPPSAMTIDVYYSPQIGLLADDDAVPREVPEQHHEIIAVRATKMLLDQGGKDSRTWDRNYAELVQMMNLDLASWNRTGPWVRDVGAMRA